MMRSKTTLLARPTRASGLANRSIEDSMNIVRLPDMGASTGEAEVVVWLKRVGEAVTAGEALLEVQSDKANVEVEATSSGVLAQVLAEEGQLLPAGAPVAVI